MIYTTSSLSYLVYAFIQWMNSVSACYLPGTLQEIYSSQQGQWCLCSCGLCVFGNRQTSLLCFLDFALDKKRIMLSSFLFYPQPNALCIWSPTQFLLQSSSCFSCCVLFFLCLPMVSGQHLLVASPSFYNLYSISVTPSFPGFPLASVAPHSWYSFWSSFSLSHLILPLLIQSHWDPFCPILFTLSRVTSSSSPMVTIYCKVPSMYLGLMFLFHSECKYSNCPIWHIYLNHWNILIAFSLGHITSFLPNFPPICSPLPSFSIIST